MPEDRITIDPILSLAFSMHSYKGVYALLIGSGVSRSAGIPTGWEITLDLIRKLAHLQGADCENDPTGWYEETFHEGADYSKLLKVLAKTSIERNRLLRSYFEPNEEEKIRCIKVPTQAHKSITNLVVNGYIKVIITTNFDHLMEKALEYGGIVPIVISTTDAIAGAPPIIHTQCTLIKVNGDYLDTRIKNTPEELAKYSKGLNNLLDRIFDEFGLIICGWSGDWDTALCDIIQRCKSRRFTTYWAVKDNLSETAKQFADHRQANLIQIHSADLFFLDLAEKVDSIEKYSRPHPLSSRLAVVILKKYLEDKKDIQIHDYVIEETKRVCRTISIDIDSSRNKTPTQEEFLKQVKTYETSSETLRALACCLGYWGNHIIQPTIVKVLEMLAESQKEKHGFLDWIRLRLYPALLVLYSLGISSLASKNYDVLASALIKPRNKYDNHLYIPLTLNLFAKQVINDDIGHWFPGHERAYTPTNNHLYELLKPELKEYLADEREYDDLFDRFEYLQSIVITDYYLQTSDSYASPLGRFGWKNKFEPERNMAYIFEREISSMNLTAKQPILKLFGNSNDRLRRAKKMVDEYIKSSNWH